MGRGRVIERWAGRQDAHVAGPCCGCRARMPHEQASRGKCSPEGRHALIVRKVVCVVRVRLGLRHTREESDMRLEQLCVSKRHSAAVARQPHQLSSKRAPWAPIRRCPRRSLGPPSPRPLPAATPTPRRACLQGGREDAHVWASIGWLGARPHTSRPPTHAAPAAAARLLCTGSRACGRAPRAPTSAGCSPATRRAPPR